MIICRNCSRVGSEFCAICNAVSYEEWLKAFNVRFKMNTLPGAAAADLEDLCVRKDEIVLGPSGGDPVHGAGVEAYRR